MSDCSLHHLHQTLAQSIDTVYKFILMNKLIKNTCLYVEKYLYNVLAT